jgi:hypothetical protein
MGEHKAKQYNQKQYLQHNPFCCYCGALATTTDHIPSRVYFIKRNWPEGFEFPACNKCNAETRIDEQVVAFLFNLSLINNSPAIDDLMNRLGKGIANNAPEILVEWGANMPTSASGRKRAFRDAFGPLGDELRHQKCGMIDIGPLTKQSVDRYITKLGKTLFYKHVGRILDGYIFPDWHNIYTDPAEALQQRLRNLQKFAKDVVIPERANKPMTEQFFYRYHCDPDRGLLFAAVMFSEQMMFDLIVVTAPAMERLLSDVGQIETKSEFDFARQQLNFPTEPTKARFPHTEFSRNAAELSRQ